MPTYEYECRACGHRFEEVHSIHADALKLCPICGRDSLYRIVSGGLGFRIGGQPRTLGALADKNAAAMDGRGELPPQTRRSRDYVIPWWRKGKHKIDYRILNNPQKYIETGSV